MATAIVLGGGGLVGIGWMTGVLAALEEAGALRLGDAAAVIGTSAGSAVGTAILQSGSAADQFDIMVRASRRNDELTPEGDVASALEAFFEVASSGAPRAERARQPSGRGPRSLHLRDLAGEPADHRTARGWRADGLHR